jgi:hypothetical protein
MGSMTCARFSRAASALMATPGGIHQLICADGKTIVLCPLPQGADHAKAIVCSTARSRTLVGFHHLSHADGNGKHSSCILITHCQELPALRPPAFIRKKLP